MIGAAVAGRGWIASPGFDLAMFICSPLAGLALLAAYPLGGQTLTLAVATLVGGPHYLATLSFYFWDEMAEDRQRRWAAFFLGPLAIAAGVASLAMMKLAPAVSLIIYFWNTWHVSRQNCGIMSIYRQRGGEDRPLDRTLVNGAILSVSFAMAFAHPSWYPLLDRALARIDPRLPSLLPWLLTPVAAAALTGLICSLIRRRRSGRAARPVELAFLASSLLMFHPYLWVRDPNLATLAVLFGHFIQYLAIVWLVNRRRAAVEGDSTGQRAIRRLWSERRLLIPTFLIAGGLFLLVQISLMAATVTLVLIHFYLDGLVWAFSRPVIRRSLGPLLLGWPSLPGRPLTAAKPAG